LKKFLIITSVSFLVLSACNLDEILNESENSNISAKSKLSEVINKARNDFAGDAQLSAIYGWNVSTKGEIDLLKPDQNAFVYVVQSDSDQANEFYVPVFGSSPVRSLINFTTMLSFVKDQTAKDIMENVFGTLSSVHIESSVSYDDSPAVIKKLISRTDVSSFRNTNSGSKIDMLLIPNKSIDTTSVTNSADWIVNFYGDTASLVLWLHPGTVNGTVTKISE
jgi:hypothetical protein